MNIPNDFKEFLKLLNAHRVEYLVIGGYAVGHYGYPRYTADIDIWIAPTAETAEKVMAALREFGFDAPDITADLFTRERSIVRMGVPPVRIEITNSIDGVEFDACYARRAVECVDDTAANLISLEDLKTNKRASGRHKDLDDLQHLP